MHSMGYIGKVFHNFKEFYNEINTATLTGAIDVIVVEQPDGTYNCSPFHVRFGKLGVLRSREKVVDIEINGETQNIHMKLGESGEAFFVEELEDDQNEIPEHLATSPIPVSELENIFTTHGRRRSFDMSLDPNNPVLENQLNDYSKRRNTADSDHVSCAKSRERDFLKRQINLGNIGIGENSAEDVSLSNATKLSAEDLSRDNDVSDTIFKMDSLEMDTSKSDSSPLRVEEEGVQSVVATTPTGNKTTTTTTTAVMDDPSGESRSNKKKRRKTKKKNAPRKSSSVNQLAVAAAAAAAVVPPETADKNELLSVVTDPSSNESNYSEHDMKEMQHQPEECSSSTTTNSRRIIDPDVHFFSDTELTTNALDSRADTPVLESVQSDSELEVKTRKGDNKDEGQSWEWGGFPSVSQANSPTGEQAASKPDQSIISNVLSFMKKNRGQNDGIYLSDIHSMDPEVAALYFSQNKEQSSQDADMMDCESGNGPSLAQSPNSGDGCKSIDSDFDEQLKGTRTYASVDDISMSLCGWDPEPDANRFAAHAITFSDFCNNPLLLDDPNLVVAIKGKHYNWKVAGPIISSLLVFNRPLLQTSIDQLCTVHMPAAAVVGNDEPKGGTKQTQSSWWLWGRSRNSIQSSTTVPIAVAGSSNLGKSRRNVATSSSSSSSVKDATAIEIDAAALDLTTSSARVNVTDSSLDLLGRPRPHLQHADDAKDDCNISMSPGTPPLLTDKCRKTLRLSSRQIVSLNLRDGMNVIEFSVTTAYQGTSRCKCHLYKWKWDDKIVISDIDGTITKSDVLGHILPIVGKDWAQSGVAQLFNKIKGNGYKLLYLSARAIGQARITRDYLKSIKQGDLTMPDGPILLNPTSLITAFHREVIEKKPEAFKISCMSDIKALFPADPNPFYAGYGNRINDVWAYRAVGIPIVRIFTINPKGELKHELTQTFQSSYASMTYFVDQLFPPLIEAANDYNQFAYWRDPLPSLEELLPE